MSSSRSGAEALLHRLVAAWNRRDGAAFAALFRLHAEYVTGEGRWLRGRQAIRELVDKEAPGPAVSMDGEPSVRTSGRVSAATFRGASSARDGRPSRGVVTTLIVRTAEGWFVDRLQNTDVAEKG